MILSRRSSLRFLALSQRRNSFFFSLFLGALEMIGVSGILALPTGAQALPVKLPLALIYKGPGSCDEGQPDGCSESAGRIAQAAGFHVIFVGPDGREAEAHWNEARLWVQPGGRARIQIQTMTPELLSKIRDFVREGGGYVGFCAGGFLATEHFGWVNEKEPKNSFESDALGLLPGNSRYYHYFDEELSKEKLAKVIPTTWQGKPRSVYWELGPYFDASSMKKGVQVLAHYEEGLGMALRSHFGRGRVAVTAFHPEAPESWYTYYQIHDPDGLDADIATELMLWTTDSVHRKGF